MIKGLQKFQKTDGYIFCVKCGWIAIDIPLKWKITEAEIRGTSTRYPDSKTPQSYYDIALNGIVRLHIFRTTIGGSLPSGTFQPYFFEEYPC